MVNEFKRIFKAKEADYNTVLGEIGVDMGEFAAKFDKTGDAMIATRFQAAKKLIEAAVANLEEIGKELYKDEGEAAA
jgi:hypothetical protein